MIDSIVAEVNTRYSDPLINATVTHTGDGQAIIDFPVDSDTVELKRALRGELAGLPEVDIEERSEYRWYVSYSW